MNDDPLSQRLLALEDRIARIEKLLRVESPAVPVPPPLPPVAAAAPADAATTPSPPGVPPPPLPSARPPRVPPEKKDLERFFGLAVLGRVGAGALLLAAAYFGQLGWTRLGPAARVLIIYAGGALLLGAGVLLRSRVVPRYVALLWGAGTALTYLGGTLANLHYHLLPSVPAMLSLLGSAVLGQWLGRVLRLEAFATIALAGAYAAPVLVGTPSPTPTAFFGLLVLLHTWAAYMQWRWSWHWARGFAVAATAALVAGWYARNGLSTVLSMVVHLELVLLCVTAPEWLAAFARSQVARPWWLLLLAACTTVQVVLLPIAWGNGECVGFGLVAGGVLLAVGASLAPRAAILATGPARLGSVLLVFGALQVWSQTIGERSELAWYRIGSLLAACLGLLLLRRLTLVGELAAVLALSFATGVLLERWPSGVERWQVVPVVVGAAALVRFGRPPAPVPALVLACGAALFGLCHAFTFVGSESQWLPIALAVSSGLAVLGVLQAGLSRDRVLLRAAVVLLAALAAVWTLQALPTLDVPAAERGLPLVLNMRLLASLAMLATTLVGLRSLPADEPVPRTVLAIAALTIGYCAGLLEVITAVDGMAIGWSRVATSLYTLVFAGALLASGFVWRRPALRWTGLVGFAVVALKVTLFDLANVDTPLRVLAAGGLGAVLLLAAFAYARTRGRDTAAS